MKLIFIPVFIMLAMVAQKTAMANNTELRVFATVVNGHYVQSLKKSPATQTGKTPHRKISVQIGGIPQMSINVKVNNTLSNVENRNMEYILNKEGLGFVSINEKTFYLNRIGTVQINY